MKKYLGRWIFGVLIILTVTLFGFTFVIQEGTIGVISRFGAPRAEIYAAGLYFKWPWPFEKVIELDGRYHYFDTSFAEILTRDKRNIILQTYAIWSIAEPQLFVQTLGEDLEIAELHLNTMLIDAKNAVLGRHDMSALVSTKEDELKLDLIESTIYQNIVKLASDRFGIKINQIGLKKIGLPQANVNAVLDQMRSERQQLISRYDAEGLRDANRIISETDILVAEIHAEGREKAAMIVQETEAAVAQVYAQAYRENDALFLFLLRMQSLERILGPKTTLIFTTESSPFNVFNQESLGGQQ